MFAQWRTAGRGRSRGHRHSGWIRCAHYSAGRTNLKIVESINRVVKWWGVPRRRWTSYWLIVAVVRGVTLEGDPLPGGHLAHGYPPVAISAAATVGATHADQPPRGTCWERPSFCTTF